MPSDEAYTKMSLSAADYFVANTPFEQSFEQTHACISRMRRPFKTDGLACDSLQISECPCAFDTCSLAQRAAPRHALDDARAPRRHATPFRRAGTKPWRIDERPRAPAQAKKKHG